MVMMLTVVLACSSTPPAEPVPAAPEAVVSTSTTESASAHDPQRVAEALKMADLADGTEDKVAHKCAGCALSMDGDPAHALDVNGTTLHLCASMCKEYFSKDPEGSLVGLLD